MKRMLVLAMLAASFVPVLRAAVTVEEAKLWREDLRFMAAEMEKRHKNLYHTLSREQFAGMVQALDGRIPELERHQIIVELARIAAAVGDGHTNLAPTRDAKIGFHTLPLRLYFFDDGLYVRAADRAHEGLVGARVVRIGSKDAGAAYATVRPLIGRDNEWGVRYWAPFFLAIPEVLQATGIIDSIGEVPLVVERAAKQETVTLTTALPMELMPADTDVSWGRKEGWVDARGGDDPLWLQQTANEHWMTTLPGTRTLYVQVNKIGDAKEESLADFAAKLQARVEEEKIDKLVLDLRRNRGGNGMLNQPLIRALIKSDGIDQPGHLFVLIGRSTFSAAQFLVDDLERYTHPIFVGEPSASNGHIYGDSRKIVLPNSGITVRVSIYEWNKWDPWDLREATMPQIAAPLTFDEYRHNVDPALVAVANYAPGEPLGETLRKLVESGDAAAARTRLQAYQRDPVNRSADIDALIVGTTDKLFQAGKVDASLTLARLETAAFPKSLTAHLLVAQALQAKGDKAGAIAEVERALAIDPKNDTALQFRAELRK
jgi:tetratricopeptide (TPR) repeat protein